MTNDPEMNDIIMEFCKESHEIFNGLNSLLDDLDDNPNQPKKFEQFGQTIDRVMGAAQTIGLAKFGILMELGKILGYKTSQIANTSVQELVISILFDMVEVSQKYIDGLTAGKSTELKELGIERITNRAKIISEKFSNITRASVATDSVSADDTKKINELLKNLGT